MSSCHHCGTGIPPGTALYRNSECPSCHWDLRVCKNCRHYSPGAAHDCRETIQEPVLDKERGNFCDWFSLKADSPDQVPGRKGPDFTARNRFEQLFRDGPGE